MGRHHKNRGRMMDRDGGRMMDRDDGSQDAEETEGTEEAAPEGESSN